MPKKRKITCNDLYKFHLVADAQISPDGKDVLFTLTRFHPDRKMIALIGNDLKRSYGTNNSLYLVPVSGGTAVSW